MIQIGKYGVETTFYFPLITRDLPDFLTGATHASGDIKIIKDGGAAATAANAFVSEGSGWYSLTLTAEEMEAARICISVIDQSDPKIWEDQGILIQTHGHASASLPFDLAKVTQDVNVTQVNASTPAAQKLAAGANLAIIGTAVTGTLTSSSMTTDLTGYENDQLLKRSLYFTSGPLAGMAVRILDYAETNGLITFDVTYTGDAPANGNTFIII